MFHVAVATPVLVGPTMEYTISLANLIMYFAQHRIYEDSIGQAMKILTPAESCVLSQSRESMVDDALKIKDMTHLLFIDSDMGFEPQALHILAQRRVPYVGCNYLMKQQTPELTAMRKDRTARVFTGPDQTGLEEAWYTGFGFALIERKVLEAVKKPRFPIFWNSERNRYTTEDYPFCQAVWDAGFPVFVDHDASKLVWHMGKKSYNWKEASDGKRDQVDLRDSSCA